MTQFTLRQRQLSRDHAAYSTTMAVHRCDRTMPVSTVTTNLSSYYRPTLDTTLMDEQSKVVIVFALLRVIMSEVWWIGAAAIWPSAVRGVSGHYHRPLSCELYNPASAAQSQHQQPCQKAHVLSIHQRTVRQPDIGPLNSRQTSSLVASMIRALAESDLPWVNTRMYCRTANKCVKYFPLSFSNYFSSLKLSCSSF